MHIEGKISYVGPVQSGTSQKGTPWQKQEFAVVYQEGRFPLSILLPVMDANVVGKLQVGQQVSVDFDCEVRPYTKDGVQKMFNNFTIWRDGIHVVSASSGWAQQPAQQAAQPSPAQGGSDPDLLF